MAAAGKAEGKVKNTVNENAVWVETIEKEQRHQKLYTHFGINPFKKIHVVTGKPNSFHDAAEAEEDDQFRAVINRANDVPVRKYTEPQTAAQEIGWMTQHLTDLDRTDPRFFFPRSGTSITRGTC